MGIHIFAGNFKKSKPDDYNFEELPLLEQLRFTPQNIRQHIQSQFDRLFRLTISGDEEAEKALTTELTRTGIIYEMKDRFSEWIKKMDGDVITEAQVAKALKLNDVFLDRLTIRNIENFDNRMELNNPSMERNFSRLIDFIRNRRLALSLCNGDNYDVGLEAGIRVSQWREELFELLRSGLFDNVKGYLDIPSCETESDYRHVTDELGWDIDMYFD